MKEQVYIKSATIPELKENTGSCEESKLWVLDDLNREDSFGGG